MKHNPHILAPAALILSILQLQLLTPTLSLYAAVPLRWTVETSRVQPAVFEAIRGESLYLEAALQSNGKPLAVTDGADVRLLWQTNGMDRVFWSTNAVLVSSNVIAATFLPSFDPGASSVTGFLGIPGSNYRAAFQLRFRHGPGAVPNELQIPTPVIDFAKVTVLNPPWSGFDTNAVIDIAQSVVAPAVNAAVNTGRAITAAAAAAGTNYTDTAVGQLSSQLSQQKADKSTVYTKEESDEMITRKRDVKNLGVLGNADDPKRGIVEWERQDLWGGTLTWSDERGSWYGILYDPYGEYEIVPGHTPIGSDDMSFFLYKDGELVESGYNCLEIGEFKAVTVDRLAKASYVDQEVAGVVDRAVTAAVESVDAEFRRVGDEYVYEPSGFTDFTWSGDREDMVEKIGNTQPYVDYEDGDYVAWYVSFYWGNDYYYGNAYDVRTAPSVTFYFEGYVWDDMTQDWLWDTFELTASRQVTGWDKSSPEDTFAHQKELTRAVRAFNAMSNTLYAGESKRIRTGRDNEYGTGYGYLRKPFDSDFRTWRIRAPKVTFSGLSKTTQTVNPTPLFSGGTYSRATLFNPASLLTEYSTGLATVTHTEGIGGTDGVRLADYHVGMLRRNWGTDEAGFYVNYDVRNLSDTPRVFVATPVTNGWEVVTNFPGVARMLCRDLPYAFGPSQSSNYYYAYFDRIYISPDPVVFTNVFNTVFHYVNEEEGYSYYTSYFTRDEPYKRVPVSVSFSTTQNDDYFLPAGRIVTDETANLYWDPMGRCTYRIACSNGCFFSEAVSSKDWRKEDL